MRVDMSQSLRWPRASSLRIRQAIGKIKWTRKLKLYAIVTVAAAVVAAFYQFWAGEEVAIPDSSKTNTVRVYVSDPAASVSLGISAETLDADPALASSDPSISEYDSMTMYLKVQTADA